MKRYIKNKKWLRVNLARKANAVRWGRSGPREPDCLCVETLRYTRGDGLVRSISWRRGAHGRINLTDGTVTTATELAARMRGWMGRMPVIREA